MAFLAAVGRALQQQGTRVGIVAFHEGAARMLERAGFPVAGIHRFARAHPVTSERRAALAQLGPVDPLLPDAESRVRHEQLVSGRPAPRLLRKSLDYEALLTDALAAWGRPVVVQELSGFIGPLTLYIAARRLGLRHLFIEPAMFARRLVFTENTLEARLDPSAEGSPADAEAAAAYVNTYLDRRPVLIPLKDRHFFLDMTPRAVLTLNNFRKLGRKLAHKYLLGIREEYDAIGEYVRRHLLRLVRRRWLARAYQRPVPGERFVYFPFHVPLDVQLTLRSPAYLDQEGFACRVAESLPPGFQLYVKEHPASIGAHRLAALRPLLATGRVRLIHPGVNSFELIRDAAAVVTINSKVGAEALMQGRPVIVAGRAFYRGHGVTIDIEGPHELRGALEAAPATPPATLALRRFLARVWSWTRPGELFDASPENVETFVASLRAVGACSGSAIRPEEPLAVAGPAPRSFTARSLSDPGA